LELPPNGSWFGHGVVPGITADNTYIVRFRYTGTDAGGIDIVAICTDYGNNPAIYISLWGFMAYDSASNTIVETTHLSELSRNVWIEFKVVVSGRTVTFFQDGVQKATGTAGIDNPFLGMESFWVATYKTVAGNDMWVDQIEWNCP
jgi:hypothetical protein